MEAIHDVCRLCLSEENLVWVFDGRFDNNDDMKTVIMLTTGVEIHKKDVISQKVCTKCGQVAIKMFQFRENSLKNDKYLKDQCRNLLRDKDIKIPNTDVTIKTEKMEEIEDEKKEPKPAEAPYKVHPSLYALSKQYPKTHFPSICVRSHVSPIVSMEMDAVEKYFQARNLKMQDYVRLALRLNEPQPNSAISIVAQDPPVTLEDEREQNNNKVHPINIVKSQSDGYSVRISVDESDPENNQKEHEKMMRKRRRRLSDDDLSESEPKKAALEREVAKPTESRPALLCELCSEMFDNPKALRKHKNRHLRCQYCKSKFASLSAKQLHVDNACHHKKAMGNFPDVEVNKIEYDALARRNYPEAFREFPPLPGSATQAAMDVIEILSDDEDEKMRANKPPPKNSISLIKPDIKISDSTLLDKVGKQPSDVHQLKELLVLLENVTKSDKSLQTELPQNDSIKVDETALTIDLAGLKHLVNHYKIPVNVTKFGPLKATYNYEVVKEKPKKLLYWNDLKPIDVKKSSTIRRNDSNSVPEVLNPKRTDENSKPGYSFENKQYTQSDEILFEKIADFCAKVISSSSHREPAMSNGNDSSIMELLLGEKSNDTTIAPATVQNMSLLDLLTSSGGGADTTSDYATITLSNPSQQHSMVLLPIPSPSNQSSIPSNVLTRKTPPSNRHSMPSTVLPKTSPNNQNPLSTQIHSNESIRRTSPNIQPSMPSQILARTSPNIQTMPYHAHSRTSPDNQPSMPSQIGIQLHTGTPSNNQHVMPYHAHARTPYNQAAIPTQTQSITFPNDQPSQIRTRKSPNNQHTMPSQMHARTSPDNQPSQIPARTSPNNQHSMPSYTHAITSPDNQHSMPAHTHAITSPNNQHTMPSHTHARTSPDNQPSMSSHTHAITSPNNQPSQIRARTSPNNQHSMPSQMHARTSPDNQPPMASHTHAITSPNNQPSQIRARTSPNNQHSMPSQMHARTSPDNQPSQIPARTSPNNQHSMPSQMHAITSPNNQHSMPSQMHARTSPDNQPSQIPARTSPNNQHSMPSQMHAITSPNNQPSMPPHTHAITSPNNQPSQIRARTSPNNQDSMPSQMHARTSPDNQPPMASLTHAITSPNNQPAQIRARTSPNNQHYMPSQMHAITSPNNQPSMPSHTHAITSPNNQPSQIRARTSPNNQHSMPSQMHARTSPDNQPSQIPARTSPNNQHSMPSQMHAITSPNNQPPMPSHTHAITSPNNQPSMPPHTHAITSPNNQPSQIRARTSPNNQPRINSNEPKRRTPLSNQSTHRTHVSMARQPTNNPPFESVVTRPNNTENSDASAKGSSLNNALSNSSAHALTAATYNNSDSFDTSSLYSVMNQPVQHSQNLSRYYQSSISNEPPPHRRYPHPLNINNMRALAQMPNNFGRVWYPPPPADYANVNNGHLGDINIPGMNYRGMTPNIAMYDHESARFVPNLPTNRSHSAIRNDRMPQRPPPPSYNETSWLKTNYKMPVEPFGTKDINNSIRVKNLCELR